MQIGGSIGEQIGEKLRFNEKDKKIMLMSGISAAFSALFGTPMAAAFLAMEIASIGIMYYAALVPCIWASLTAYMLAKTFHQRKRDFNEFFYLSHTTYYPSYIFSAFSIRAAMLNFELSTEKSGGLWKGFFR